MLPLPLDVTVIAVIAYSGITPFHLSVPCLVFDASRGGHFNVRVCAADGTPLTTSAGFDIATGHGLEALADADLVISRSRRAVC